MTGLRAFADLTPREVLALAMDVERNNARRFESLASMFVGLAPEVEQLLEGLCQEELSHVGALQKAWDDLYGSEEPPKISESDVKEVVEAVDIDDGEHAIFDTIDKARALELVAASEQAAIDFYRRASAATSDPELEAVFKELLTLEEGHLDAVERVQKGAPE